MNKAKYIIWKKGGWWYFRLEASNGQILFTSHQYASRRNAQHGIDTIAQLIKSTPRVTFE